ncbi:MAG TPA: hypothetical protein VKU92_11280 [Acidimicrobiales bacterium]|nr:hypothetical protein [Acidimicrobiales bacterium]
MIPLTWPHHWAGVFSYDEGAYVGSAIELARGLVPYKDFAFVQPPGISLLLAPVAGLFRLAGLGTEDVLSAARVMTAIATALGSGLAALALRHRGVVGMMVAGGALAAFPLAYTAFSSTLLEPYLDLLCLAGVVLLFRGGHLATGWRLALAGLAFGLAFGFKVWAVIPAGLGVLWVFRSGARDVARYTGGVVAGVAAIYGPFLALAPRAFIRDVFLAQVNRLDLVGFGFHRFVLVSGVKYLRLPAWWAVLLIAVWVALLAAAHLLAPTADRSGRSFEWYVAVVAVVILCILMLGHPYYAHYSDILAPWAALSAGSLVARAVVGASGRLALRGSAGDPARSRRSMTGLVMAVVLVAIVVVPTRELWSARKFDTAPQNAAILRLVSATPATSCVVSDESEMLEAANRLTTGGPLCPVVIDSDGERLVTLAELGRRRAAYVALAAQWQRWFGRARYVYLTRRFHLRIPWTRELSGWFHRHFVRVRLPARDEILGWWFRRR